AGAVLDVEVEAAGEDQVGAETVAQGMPEVLLLGELVEVEDREVDRSGLGDLEIGLAPQDLEQIAFELLLNVDVASLEAVLPLLADDDEGGDGEGLASGQVQLGALRQLEPDLDRGLGRRQGRQQEQDGESPGVVALHFIPPL